MTNTFKKPSLGYMLLSPISFIVIITGFILLLSAEQAKSEVGHAATALVVFFLLATLSSCFYIPMLFLRLRSQLSAWDKVRSTFLTQEIMDEKLEEQARKFDAVCTKQVQLHGIESAADELQKVTAEIKVAKSAFWEAYTLAQELGFTVKPSYMDYLHLAHEPLTG